eukprot:g3274.t1
MENNEESSKEVADAHDDGMDTAAAKDLVAKEKMCIRKARETAMTDILAHIQTPAGKRVMEIEKRRQKEIRRARENQWKTMSKARMKNAKLLNSFCAYDMNGSETLDIDQFVLLAKDLCVQMSDKEMKAKFRQVDSDQNGEIDFEEFKSWYEQEKRTSGAGKRFKRFMRKTSRKDGSIDAAFARRELVMASIAKASKIAKRDFVEKNPKILLAYKILGMKVSADMAAPSTLPSKDASVTKVENEARESFDNSTADFVKSSPALSSIDKNNDGVISTEELVSALKNRDVDLKSSLLSLARKQDEYSDAEATESSSTAEGKDNADSKSNVSAQDSKAEEPEESLVEKTEDSPGIGAFFCCCCRALVPVSTRAPKALCKLHILNLYLPALFWLLLRPWGPDVIAIISIVPLMIEWIDIRKRISQKTFQSLFDEAGAVTKINADSLSINKREYFVDILNALFIVCTTCYDSGSKSLTDFATFISMLSIVILHLVSMKFASRELVLVQKAEDRFLLWSLFSLVLRIFGIIYIPWCLTFFVRLARLSSGYCIMVFWASFQCDTGALVIGRLFGKNRAIELISPNKTWEGFLGGIVSSLLSMCFMYTLRSSIPVLPNESFLEYISIDVLCIVGSVVGDLLESMLKRAAGLKDSGTLFPGHGGALDRADALLLTFPLMYFYFKNLI